MLNRRRAAACKPRIRGAYNRNPVRQIHSPTALHNTGPWTVILVSYCEQ